LRAQWLPSQKPSATFPLPTLRPLAARSCSRVCNGYMEKLLLHVTIQAAAALGERPQALSGDRVQAHPTAGSYTKSGAMPGRRRGSSTTSRGRENEALAVATGRVRRDFRVQQRSWSLCPRALCPGHDWLCLLVCFCVLSLRFARARARPIVRLCGTYCCL